MEHNSKRLVTGGILYLSLLLKMKNIYDSYKLSAVTLKVAMTAPTK